MNVVPNNHKLLTTGDDDPLLDQLISAIRHATEINIAVSFIRHSGLQLLLPALKARLGDDEAEPVTCCILTSDYLQITEAKALKNLLSLQSDNCEIKVFETGQINKSFHLKSYIFLQGNTPQKTGSAFVGSNNISKAALTDAYEWCLRFDVNAESSTDTQEEFAHIVKSFDELFHHSSAVSLTNTWIKRYEQEQPANLQQFLKKESKTADPFIPNLIQAEALAALKDTRHKGYSSGLVVLATGMGKTWLSAFDAKQMYAASILFVAHREEILNQAFETYAKLWPEKSAGFYHGSAKQADKAMIFASVQTLSRDQHLTRFEPTHFDYIVVDEFHHASSNTYKKIIHYFEPKFLLGITATPDRPDQADILSLCANNLVYDKHLVDGIDSNILVPFHYYGILDETVDYEHIPWRNGKFDPKALDAELATTRRAQHVFSHWKQHQQTRTLAFCASTRHADYMAEAFNQQFGEKGLKGVAVHSQSSMQRKEALTQLKRGDIHVIFCVDIFNEGTDLPSIDTVLMLRPTESTIIFLQQLGRGLRTCEGKSHLVVVDFIGNHKSFITKADALGIGDLRKSGDRDGKREQQVPTIGKGCHIKLDPEVIDLIKLLRAAYKNTPLDHFHALMDHFGRRPTLTEFYQAGYSLDAVKRKHGSWFEMVIESQTESQADVDIMNQYKSFLKAMQATSMTKSFKAILLEAFIALDGFSSAPTLEALAEKSRQLLDRYPRIKVNDLAETVKDAKPTDRSWLTYWRNNPVNALAGSEWFSEEDGAFISSITVQEDDKELLDEYLQEIIDYRLAQYVARLPEESDEDNLVKLPYYPNIKIACGHFKTGRDDDAELMVVDAYNVNPERHFVARASGNSMNGGKNPILDGDLLLLEWITPNSAGSITGKTLVIERQDETGDNQYLLRVIEKRGEHDYWLKANNPDYETIPVGENLRQLARLVRVIK